MHSECYGQEALRSFWRQFHLISSLTESLHWLGHCTGWVIALAGSLHYGSLHGRYTRGVFGK